MERNNVMMKYDHSYTSNSLPLYLKKNQSIRWIFNKAVKIAEYKSKTVYNHRCEPYIIYCYNGLYYDRETGKYYFLQKHRNIDIDGDSDKEFDKKTKIKPKQNWWLSDFKRWDETSRSYNIFLKHLTKHYDEHLKMMNKKNADKAIKEKKKKVKLLKADKPHYNENWNGIVL